MKMKDTTLERGTPRVVPLARQVQHVPHVLQGSHAAVLLPADR
ncbi:hypothetical protein [Paraburkholderia sartisoli]|nr:hypothetical protein [Paraburkholderia sartisoli]